MRNCWFTAPVLLTTLTYPVSAEVPCNPTHTRFPVVVIVTLALVTASSDVPVVVYEIAVLATTKLTEASLAVVTEADAKLLSIKEEEAILAEVTAEMAILSEVTFRSTTLVVVRALAAIFEEVTVSASNLAVLTEAFTNLLPPSIPPV